MDNIVKDFLTERCHRIVELNLFRWLREDHILS